jgi:LPS-assembly lipoprotein
VILDILQELRQKTVVGVNASGLVREFQLRLQLRFRLRTPGGEELLAPTQLEQTRDISFNESVVLAKESEEALLYRDMQADILQQVLRRLAAVKSIPVPAPPLTTPGEAP